MSQSPAPPAGITTPVIPSLHYPDSAAAVDFLCQAFGFARLRVFTDGQGRVQHGELSYGAGLVMIGALPDGVSLDPDRPGPYVIVADVAAHLEHAVACGAEVIEGPRHESFGSLYSCRDPQGQRWTFGDYDPWAGAGT